MDIYNTPAVNLGRYCNRTLCGTLDDLRQYIKVLDLETKQVSMLLSLIEEVQIYANRMEAKLLDVSEYNNMKKKYKKMKKAVNKTENK